MRVGTIHVNGRWLTVFVRESKLYPGRYNLITDDGRIGDRPISRESAVASIRVMPVAADDIRRQIQIDIAPGKFADIVWSEQPDDNAIFIEYPVTDPPWAERGVQSRSGGEKWYAVKDKRTGKVIKHRRRYVEGFYDPDAKRLRGDGPAVGEFKLQFGLTDNEYNKLRHLEIAPRVSHGVIPYKEVLNYIDRVKSRAGDVDELISKMRAADVRRVNKALAARLSVVAVVLSEVSKPGEDVFLLDRQFLGIKPRRVRTEARRLGWHVGSTRVAALGRGGLWLGNGTVISNSPAIAERNPSDLVAAGLSPIDIRPILARLWGGRTDFYEQKTGVWMRA